MIACPAPVMSVNTLSGVSSGLARCIDGHAGDAGAEEAAPEAAPEAAAEAPAEPEIEVSDETAEKIRRARARVIRVRRDDNGTPVASPAAGEGERQSWLFTQTFTSGYWEPTDDSARRTMALTVVPSTPFSAMSSRAAWVIRCSVRRLRPCLGW